METIDDLVLIGLNHRSAPVEVRERYAVQPEDLERVLAELRQLGGVEEVVVISTCNRTEVLARAVPAEDPTEALALRLFRNLEPEHLYSYRGVPALIHLYRLVSGLDSLVLGETEILGQVRRAAEAAHAAGTVGALLAPLLQQALGAGKKVRTETSLGEGTLSVARVAVDTARQAFGQLAGRRVVVVGAGETGRLLARHLQAEGADQIDFVNRTLATAQVAVRETRGRAWPLEQLREAVASADLVATCVDNAPGLLAAGHLDRRALARRDRPTLLIDLSVPRAVEASVRDLAGVLLVDLDDLAPVVAEHLRQRGDARTQADSMLVGEVHKFLALRTYASFSPAIAELHRGFETVREEVLDRVTGGQAQARELELAHELARRLLDTALAQLKEGARATRSEEVLDRMYQRFLENL